MTTKPALLDVSAPVDSLARALIDIPSVSGDEGTIADAIEAALAPHAHLEVTRLGDAIVAPPPMRTAPNSSVAVPLT
jgi:succinyl-diaminopimelate desuccinylase